MHNTNSGIIKVLFIILDYILAVLMGTGTLFLVSLVVGRGWNIFAAMIVGMILGMLVLVMVAMVFGPISSLFQIFPSGMIITKLTGMVTGMLFAMVEVDFVMVFMITVIFSLFVQFVIDMYNMTLKGDVTVNV